MSDAVPQPARCPVTGFAGRPLRTLTLKALLRPEALATLDPRAQHYFCADPVCDTVYFTADRTFGSIEVEVPVFAKDNGKDVPVCYCFGWTRDRLKQVGRSAKMEIQEHIRLGRCGCEVNNPKGSCCLGDVQAFLAGTGAS